MIYLTNLLLTALSAHMTVLGSLISLQTLQDVLNTIGYPAVALFVFIESAGIPLPGESMVLLASFTAAVDHQLQIPIIIACAATGAIMGDNLGYLIGRTGGRAFVERFGKFFFLKSHHLASAEQFFARHGEKTVFFGRFFALLRIWAAFLAGMNGMRWPLFLLYNAAGGIVWAILAGTVGYLAGNLFHISFGQLDQAAMAFAWITIGILAVLAFALVIWRRYRKNRDSQKRVTMKLEAMPVGPEE